VQTQSLAQDEKGALKEGRTLLFVEQYGLYMLPVVVRTCAPVGQTPVLDEQLSHDHLWAMSGITLEGKLLMLTSERSTSSNVLKHLLDYAVSRHIVAVDISPAHLVTRGRFVVGVYGIGRGFTGIN
jgi:hypothetical protein